MVSPSQLSIATSSLLRLVKEEVSYHKELEQQQLRLQKSEQYGRDENADYTVKQERRAIEETKAIFPQLRDRIKAAVENLEMQLEAPKDYGHDRDEDEVSKAKEAVAQAKKSRREIP